ncbi:MAG TPA: MFS transporter, partial [Achromobacter sp.]|nr:MFS transporter [Achromobacter sp.]
MLSFSRSTVYPAGVGLPAAERLGALIAVMLAVCMASLDTAIANTALPTIARDLQASEAGSIWVISGYQLAMVAGLLPAAALGEILGHRRVYIVGLAVFTLASLASGLAPSLPVLVATRILQGLGAAGVMSVNGALLRLIYPSHMLGRGLGLNAMVVGLSFAGGPTVASAILLLGSWHWLFLVNFPIGILAAVLALRGLPDTTRSGHGFDGLAALLCGL